MVMWRALREKKEKVERLSVLALECLGWCEVDVNIHMFFAGYSSGLVGPDNLPLLLKLKEQKKMNQSTSSNRASEIPD
ncbi:hypothetical protein ZEAMMB73_Zm00001d046963 [Zea mays]|uniref:Uncharacterized protein n=1 Tax=Zea mays TaxID=4577 RepID=A0A1D6P5P6_MAIZE|nr:hypothetical protein ZEAMMB73_Zm00001d046963 [Zea mays]